MIFHWQHKNCGCYNVGANLARTCIAHTYPRNKQGKAPFSINWNTWSDSEVYIVEQNGIVSEFSHVFYCEREYNVILSEKKVGRTALHLNGFLLLVCLFFWVQCSQFLTTERTFHRQVMNKNRIIWSLTYTLIQSEANISGSLHLICLSQPAPVCTRLEPNDHSYYWCHSNLTKLM